MPKDPKRSIGSYQLQGGALNAFEFQKSQGKMAEESKPSPPVETDNRNLSQPERVAEVTAEAHKKVEKRRKLGATKAQDRQRPAGKKSAKNRASRSAKKTSKSAGTKKRARVKSLGKSQRPAASR
jgi:hypothetical protein